MTDSKTATERLCELLDERGVGWSGFWVKTMQATRYRHDGIGWTATEHPSGELYLTSTSITPEQAIAAITDRECLERAAKSDLLGQHFHAIMSENRELQAKLDELNTRACERHAYELRITGDGSDWGEIIRDAYDDLIAAACESCTSEQMAQLTDHIRAELGNGTLTAEQVRKVVYAHYKLRMVLDVDGFDVPQVMFDWQAIADELNAELGSEECECESSLLWDCYHGRDFYEHRLSCGHIVTSDFGEPPNYCQQCGAKVRKAVKR